jgi:hypothetical protein
MQQREDLLDVEPAETVPEQEGGTEEAAPELFTVDEVEHFRADWQSIQTAFVDDPVEPGRSGHRRPPDRAAPLSLVLQPVAQQLIIAGRRETGGPFSHLVNSLTARVPWGDHHHMPTDRDIQHVPWSNHASPRSMGEGVAALLVRRGRLGSPPA